MSARNSEAAFQGVFYVGRVPEIEFRDEAFHVAYTVGKCRFEFALPPSVFTKARLLSDEAVAKWKFGDVTADNVRALRRK